MTTRLLVNKFYAGPWFSLPNSLNSHGTPKGTRTLSPSALRKLGGFFHFWSPLCLATPLSEPVKREGAPQLSTALEKRWNSAKQSDASNSRTKEAFTSCQKCGCWSKPGSKQNPNQSKRAKSALMPDAIHLQTKRSS